MNDSNFHAPLAPIQIQSYWLKRLEISTVDDPEEGAAIDVKTALEVSQRAEDAQEWLLRLGVTFGEDMESGSHYAGVVEFEGIFRVSGEVPAEKASRLAVVNGASILYGAAREIVATVTGRGPSPGVALPSVSFAGLSVVELPAPSLENVSEETLPSKERDEVSAKPKPRKKSAPK